MMKNNLKNKKITQKNNRGITLIALVITIVLNATRGRCEECIA